VIARAFARLAIAAIPRRGCIRVEAAYIVVFLGLAWASFSTKDITS